MDWLVALDLAQASKNVRTDIFGDWHRDPWGWPEQEWLLTEQGRTHVVGALNDDGVRHGLSLDVPKENFASRPAYVFDPVDRLIYQALVDRISVDLIGALPRWSFSWRLSRKSPKPGHYVDMGNEWDGYRSRLNLLSATHDVALTTDITSFFSSIPVTELLASVHDAAGHSDVTERLGQLLIGWDRVSDRGGLPMRANASSVLATMYVKPVDDVLLQHGKSQTRRRSLRDYAFSQGTASRWVDDMWLFGDERADLRAAQLDVQEAMRSLGLDMNLGKTDVLEGDELVTTARQLEHSAVDVALDKQEPDFEPLDALIERVLVKPEKANHTSVRFATVRMRRHRRYEMLDELIAVAPRMPHASDALARAFRDSGRYLELGDWYAEYLKSKWAKLDLASARLAMMFPSSAEPPVPVRDALRERLATPCSLPLLAVSVQRLSAWNPEETRSVIRELARYADHPQVRRVLALAALNAGEGRPWVERLLQEFRENAVTLNYLQARNFKAVRAQADFTGY